MIPSVYFPTFIHVLENVSIFLHPHRNVECLELLLRHGAQFDLSDKLGRYVLNEYHLNRVVVSTAQMNQKF